MRFDKQVNQHCEVIFESFDLKNVSQEELNYIPKLSDSSTEEIYLNKSDINEITKVAYTIHNLLEELSLKNSILRDFVISFIACSEKSKLFAKYSP